MSAPGTRAGGICGWTPTTDHCDTPYSAIPALAHYASSDQDLDAASPPSSPSPRSLSLDPDGQEQFDPDGEDWPKTFAPYYNATSLRRYKAKLQVDPKWAPRPPNAFILFRRQYVEEHKGEEVQSSEKMTLSKRAGKAWRELSVEEQKVWFDAAKEKAAEHLRLNPGYVFKPNKKTRSGHRKHPALMSRREQVEAFMRKTTTRGRGATKRGRATTPGSVTSSLSPEPPETPASLGFESPFELESHSRSSSMPPPPHVACPIPITPETNNVLLSGASSGTSSSPDYSPKPFPCADGVESISPLGYFVYDDSYIESPDDLSSLSFDSYTSSPMTSFGEMTPDHLPSPIGLGGPIQMPEVQPVPSVEPPPALKTSQSVTYTPPLIERRRRSATTSMLPSPLSVVTSSLSGWTRDDLVTSRMAPPAGWGLQRPSPSSPTNQNINTFPAPTSSFHAMSVAYDGWSQPTVHHGASADYNDDLLTVAVPGMDPDRTPRGSVAAPNSCSANELPPPINMRSAFGDYSLAMAMPSSSMYMSGPVFDPLDTVSDLQSYNVTIGMRQYGTGGTQDVYGAPQETVDPYSLYLRQTGQHD